MIHKSVTGGLRVLYKKRAAVQDWQRWEKILGLLRETKGTPHCWLM